MGTDDVQKRLKEMLAWAFGGPPTPLKAIPKKDGTARGQSCTSF
jgi:hypothetical protein